MDRVKILLSQSIPKILPLVLMGILGFSSVSLAFEYPQGLNGGATSLPNPITSVGGRANSFEGLACGILVWIFWGLIVLAVIMVLVGGYRYVTSGGEPEKVKSANNTILYAAIAVGVAVIARGVPVIISNFLGDSTVSTLICT